MIRLQAGDPVRVGFKATGNVNRLIADFFCHINVDVEAITHRDEERRFVCGMVAPDLGETLHRFALHDYFVEKPSMAFAANLF